MPCLTLGCLNFSDVRTVACADVTVRKLGLCKQFEFAWIKWLLPFSLAANVPFYKLLTLNFCSVAVLQSLVYTCTSVIFMDFDSSMFSVTHLSYTRVAWCSHEYAKVTISDLGHYMIFCCRCSLIYYHEKY